MERCIDAELRETLQKLGAELVLAPNSAPDESPSASNAMHHGDFDDDERTVRSTFNRILASATTPADAKRGARAAASPDMPAAVTAEDDAAKPMFRRSASSPRDQWTQMDAKTGC